MVIKIEFDTFIEITKNPRWWVETSIDSFHIIQIQIIYYHKLISFIRVFFMPCKVMAFSIGKYPVHGLEFYKMNVQ